MRSDGQALLNQVATTRAPLRRQMRRNVNDSRASFLRFTLEYLDELSPTRVVDVLCEVAILDHATNAQAFYDNDGVSVNVFASSLVQKVPALTGYLQVCERVLEQEGVGLFVMFSNRLKHLVVQASGFHQAHYELLSLPASRAQPVLESLKHHADYTTVGTSIHRQLYRNDCLIGFL